MIKIIFGLEICLKILCSLGVLTLTFEFLDRSKAFLTNLHNVSSNKNTGMPKNLKPTGVFDQISNRKISWKIILIEVRLFARIPK
jgi:hypothetical protein